LAAVRLIFQLSCMDGRSDMKPHLSVPTSLTLLGIILLIGCATGVLWPMNDSLLNFSAAFVGTLFTILIIASLVWGACEFYFLIARCLRVSDRRY
ncbi:MAG: hypothetical protein WB390_14615, partial [Pseudolabrys sp.]